MSGVLDEPVKPCGCLSFGEDCDACRTGPVKPCACDMHGRSGMHCRACCRTFSGRSAFDAHWQRGHRAPAEAKLTEVRPGVWGWPDSGRNRPGRSGTGNLGAEQNAP